MSFFFRAAYLVGFKPWDSGVPPPQLVAVVEGSDALLPQKALDLGCGTGTNSIYMARHGWDVTGIDFVPRAVSIAPDKIAAPADANPVEFEPLDLEFGGEHPFRLSGSDIERSQRA